MAPSVDRAERALEAVDVRAGVYEAFDSQGMPLTLRIERNDRVRIEEGSATRPEPERLADLLRAALRARGDARANDTTLLLEELVSICSEFALG